MFASTTWEMCSARIPDLACATWPSAHIDTVFPANTPLNIRQQGSRIYGPGVSDNGAGVAALLGIASLLRHVRIRHALPFVFIGNVGEEGEGDLRGMRHIFSTPRWKDSIADSSCSTAARGPHQLLTEAAVAAALKSSARAGRAFLEDLACPIQL